MQISRLLSLAAIALLLASTAPAFASTGRDSNIDAAIATLNQTVTVQTPYVHQIVITNALITGESGIGFGVINPSAYYVGYSFESAPIRGPSTDGIHPGPILGYDNYVSVASS